MTMTLAVLLRRLVPGFLAVLLAASPTASSAQDRQAIVTLLCASPILFMNEFEGAGPLLADEEICDLIADRFAEDVAMHEGLTVNREHVWGKEALDRLFTAAGSGEQRYDVWIGGEPELHGVGQEADLTEASEEIYFRSARMSVSVIRDSWHYKLAYTFLDWTRYFLEKESHLIVQ